MCRRAACDADQLPDDSAPSESVGLLRATDD